MKRFLYKLTAMFLLIFCISLPIHAATLAFQVTPLAVGNQNDYSSSDSGSSSSSSSDWSSSSDSSSSDWGSSGSDWSSSGSSSGSSDSSPLEYILIIAVLIAFFALKSSKGNGAGRTGSVKPTEVYRPKPTMPSFNNIGPIRETDPNFSEESFLTWAKEVFVTLNTAWTNQDWKSIRPFESDELYNQHSRQLEEYIRKGQVNFLERVAVKESVIDRFYTEGNFEYMVVKMHVNMIDYVKETGSGKIVAGDTTTLWNMIFTMTFKRKKGMQSLDNLSELHTTNCPNCGAPTEITSSGVCPYCKSTITTGEYNWVLCDYVGQNL